MHLAAHVIRNPHDESLRELLSLVQNDRLAQSTASADSYLDSYPISLPPLGPGRVPLAALPIGGVLSLPAGGFTNLLLHGPTRTGKSNMIRSLIASLLAAGFVVVAFDPKEDLADCRLLSLGGLPVITMDWEDAQLAFLQPYPGMSIDRFINLKVELVLGENLGLQASRRLALETLHAVHSRPRPDNISPRLSDWEMLVEQAKVGPARAAGYREALLYCLKQIRFSGLGKVVDHAASSFLEKMFLGPPRAFMIRTGGLMTGDMAALFAGEFIAYRYELGGASNEKIRPAAFFFDDSVHLFQCRNGDESSVSNSPLSQWALLGNSRGVFLCAAVHSFRQTHSSFVHNCHTVATFGASGQEARALAMHLDLNESKRERLATLRPGELVIRATTQHPIAVYGRHPLIA